MAPFAAAIAGGAHHGGAAPASPRAMITRTLAGSLPRVSLTRNSSKRSPSDKPESTVLRSASDSRMSSSRPLRPKTGPDPAKLCSKWVGPFGRFPGGLLFGLDLGFSRTWL